MATKKTLQGPRYWMPLREIGQSDFNPIRPELLQESMAHYGISEEQARKMLEDEHARCRFFVNDLYQVAVAPCGPDDTMLHINIRRRDGGMFKDWRHFQQIKNEVVGPEREAFEIYPRESRKVDTSNKWHLWVLPEGTSFDAVGWKQRDVVYEENRNVPGMRQRPL